MAKQLVPVGPYAVQQVSPGAAIHCPGGGQLITFGPTYGPMGCDLKSGPNGTICSAMDGLGAAVHGPGGGGLTAGPNGTICCAMGPIYDGPGR